jgi:hypothetical protein
LNASASDLSTRKAAFQSDVIPIVTAAAAAVCSLAFFRTWVLFSTDMGGPAELALKGAALASRIAGTVPWLYLTPAGLIVVLLLSCWRLLDRSGLNRAVFAIILLAVSLPLGLWPTRALTRIAAGLSRVLPDAAGAPGATQMRLGVWWWVYFFGLVTIIAFAVIELVFAISGWQKTR